jgi:hypothetical protein
MRQAFKPTFRSFIALSLITVPLVVTAATTQTFEEFESTTLSQNGWVFGAQAGATMSVSTDKTANLNGSLGSVKASYPTPTGAVYAWATYNMASLNSREVYVDFWAKMPNAKQGLKFLKIFGGDNGGYANTTFALDYTGADYGSMYQVSFGDGSTNGNDTANVINFDGQYPNWIGRSYGKATVSTPPKKAWASSNWGTTWHHFRIHTKFNSGTTAATEVNDGEYFVEIDGVVYVDAKGLFNRHYSNLPIDRVELFGWSQSGTKAFDIWYDNVRITTGGWGTSGPSPNPPANVQVQ